MALWDNLKPITFKHLSVQIEPQIKKQNTMNTGTLPANWFKVNVKPFFKKGDNSNYLPISLTYYRLNTFAYGKVNTVKLL